MPEEDGYSLLVAFEDQSDSFVHGYEAGTIRVKMEHTDSLSQIVHTENKGTLTRMAVAFGWDIKFEPTDYEEWLQAEIVKKVEPPAVPFKLRIVK